MLKFHVGHKFYNGLYWNYTDYKKWTPAARRREDYAPARTLTKEETSLLGHFFLTEELASYMLLIDILFLEFVYHIKVESGNKLLSGYNKGFDIKLDIFLNHKT